MSLLRKSSLRGSTDEEFRLPPSLRPAKGDLASEGICETPFDERLISSRKSEWMICGYPECRGGRAVPWRNRRRPIFEDAWGCSKYCLLEMVHAAVRRECGATHASIDAASHTHRIPLGLVLLAQGWITQAQLQSALDAHRIGGGRIGECLLLQGGIQQKYITRGLGVQWACPVLSTAGLDAKEMALVMPKLFLDEFGVVPVRTVNNRSLYIGFESSLDASVAFALEQMTSLKVKNGILSTEEVASARNQLMKADYVSVVSETIADVNLLGSRITTVLQREQPVRSRLVRVHQYAWLRLWMEEATLRGLGTLPRGREDMRDYIYKLI